MEFHNWGKKMAGIKPVGRNSAIMELDGFFSKKERMAMTGDDFSPGTIGVVQQILDQTHGKTRIHIMFESGGLSQIAQQRLGDQTQSRIRGRELPQFARSRRRDRIKENRDILRNEADRIADNPQSQHIIHDGSGHTTTAAPTSPTEAVVVQYPSARGIPQASSGGFSMLISETLKHLPGYAGGGPKKTADRPLSPIRGGFITTEEHAQAINNQIDPDVEFMPVSVDNRVGAIGGWRRSDYQENRVENNPIHELKTTQQAVSEALAAMEEDGINPHAPIGGLEKKY